MGELLLAKGAAKLVIWDLDASGLSERRANLISRGYQVFTYQVDLSSGTEIEITAAKTLAEVGPIDLLINNAGVIVGKSFKEHTLAEIDLTMSVNTTALMKVAHFFLPSMIERNHGHIVNIASAASMVANPNMSVYCASKWAVVGWSDSLRLELEQQRSAIKVSTIMPYYIDTGMFAGVKSPIIPILKAPVAARQIVRAIERDKVFLRLPAIVNLLPLLRGILPNRLFDLVVGKWFGVYKSMESFKGRAPN